MTLSDDDIQEFVVAWQQDFGELLLPETARSEATCLIDFFAWMTEELGYEQRAANVLPIDAPTAT